jgi:hypothetical protein
VVALYGDFMNKKKVISCMILAVFISLIDSSAIIYAKVEGATFTPINIRIEDSLKFNMPLLPANNCDPKIFIHGHPEIDPKIFVKLNRGK